MLLRRDVLSNEPIQTLDSEIIRHQTDARKSSSSSSYKNKAKFKKPTPSQSFQIGDLVLIREGASKNKPRETFIVDTLPSTTSKFILIRKLSQTLRPKLYQVLPEEIIHAPSVNMNPPDSSRRQAAITANSRLKNCFQVTSGIKKKFKYGWTEDDQIDMFELFTPLPSCTSCLPAPLNTTHEHDDQDPTTPNRSNSLSSTDSCTSAESKRDLSWDDTPSQYTLSPDGSQRPFLPSDTHRFTSTPFPIVREEDIPAFTRSRLFASSDSTVARTPAFRYPQSDQAFISSPQHLLPATNTAPTRRSRIPTPCSPSRVKTTQVADVSQVLPQLNLPRQSSRSSQRPDRYGSSSTQNPQEGTAKEKEMFRKHSFPRS